VALMRAWLHGAALAVTLGALPGCFWVTTKAEGEALRRDVVRLKERQEEQGASLDQRTRKLDESLDRATKLLATNSADLGAEFEAVAREQATQRGQLEALRQRVEAQDARLEALTAENAALRAELEKKPPVDKDALFARAQASLKGQQYGEAQRDLREFLRLHSNDPRAPEAQYALGESWFLQKQFERAIGEYQRVIDAWPKAELVPQAFFRAGEAALAMKWCVDARAYFGVLQQRHPRSEQARAAKAKLELIKKKANDKSVCQ
jgi:tol-pal system protein YbgF